MIFTPDNQNNNIEQQQNNRKSSNNNLEELFQQLLVLDKKQDDDIHSIFLSQSPSLSPSSHRTTLSHSAHMTSSTTMDSFNRSPFFNSRETIDSLNYHTPYLPPLSCRKFPIDIDRDAFKARRRYAELKKISNQSQIVHMRTIVIVALLIVLMSISTSTAFGTTNQPNLCPKPSCECDSFEMICTQAYGGSRVPHTLSQETVRVTINNAQATHFTGLDYLIKLENIDYSHNKIPFIDFKEILALQNLKNLNVSYNNISDLLDSQVNSTFAEVGLTTSSVSHLDRLAFDEHFDMKPLKRFKKISVTNFILSHNSLATIRNYTFIRWYKLQKLDLSYNLLQTLDSQSLSGLEKLEHLNLRGNLLVQVPSLALQSSTSSVLRAVAYLPSADQEPASSTIKYLDLSENPLKYINSDSFLKLEEVLKLELESCSLDSIHDEAFKGLQKLNTLSLSKNNLTSVPSKSFEYLESLRSLKLNSNQLVKIWPGSFAYLTNLEELQINEALIKEVRHGVFEGLNSLKRLEMTHNLYLKHIESGSFEKLGKLSYLNLTSNGLSSLPSDDTLQSSLQVLDLRENPLLCGCELKWLTKWLKKFNDTIQTNTTPTQLRGTKLTVHPIGKTHYLLNDAVNSQLMDFNFTLQLTNLTCSGPAALKGKLIAELPDNKLECLKPNSMIHVNIGFANLFLITFIMTFMCLLKFCKNKKRFFDLLKENLFQNNISIVLPYSQNLHKNVDDMKKESRLYGDVYEHIDYNYPNQVFTLTGTGNGNHDSVMCCGQEGPLNTNIA